MINLRTIGHPIYYIQIKQKMLDKDQAEPAPPLPEDKEHWYLPTFDIYHPQKPEQIQVVFDSSAECDGTSLNQVLLSGPDLNNSRFIGLHTQNLTEIVQITALWTQMQNFQIQQSKF